MDNPNFTFVAPPKAVELSALSSKVTGNLDEFKDKIATTFYVFEKLDGCNTTVIVNDGEVQIFTRTGNRVRDDIFGDTFAETASRAAFNIFGEKSGVFFGEAWSPDLPFEEISGRFRSGSGQPLQFWAFDCVQAEHYRQGSSGVPFLARLGALYGKGLNVAPAVYPSSPGWSALIEALPELTRPGRDGLILRDPGATWLGGSKGKDGSIIKLKPRLEETGKVVGVYEGKGRLSGTVGAVDVQVLDSNDIIRVGSGIPDTVRALAQGLIGQYVEIASLGRSKNGSRREPTIKGIRSDMFMSDSGKRA